MSRPGFADGADELRGALLLEHIADGALVQSAQCIVFAGVSGKNDHADLWLSGSDMPDSIQAAQAWHGDVEDDYVWVKVLRQRDGLLAVDRLADNGKICLRLQQH